MLDPKSFDNYINLGVFGVDKWDGTSPDVSGWCYACDNERKCYYNAETTKFHCKVCGKKGNIYSFMQHLVAMSIEETNVDYYEELAYTRGVTTQDLMDWGVCQSYLTEELLVPAHDITSKKVNYVYRSHAHKIKLMNMRKYRDKGKEFLVPHVMGLHLVPKRPRYIFVCEGIWDAIALWSTFKQLTSDAGHINAAGKGDSLLKTYAVVAVPGCNLTDIKRLGPLCEGKDVTICFDSDHPDENRQVSGWDGARNLAQKLYSESTDTLVHALKWGEAGYDPERSDGYDLRDLIMDLDSPEKIHEFLIENTEELDREEVKRTTSVHTELITPRYCDSFTDLCSYYNRVLHFTDRIRDTLAVMLAVAVSTPMKGDQLWLRIIGPPGSGKSTLAEALSANKEHTNPVSNVTGFHSGVQTKDGRTTSPIEKMLGKTTIIKDADTLMSSPSKDRLLAELRDIYDGSSRSQYRGVGDDSMYENMRTSFILCGTDALRQLDKAFLGDRFIDIEIFGGSGGEEFVKSSMQNAYHQMRQSMGLSNGQNDPKMLKEVTSGYLNYLKDNLAEMSFPAFPPEVFDSIEALSSVIALARTKGKRVSESHRELEFKPRAELPTRLSAQFVKLSVCLAYVFGKTEVDEEVYRIVKKVGMDTTRGYQWDIMKCLAKNPKGLHHAQLIEVGSIPNTTARRCIEVMELLGILTTKSDFAIKGRGRKPNLYVLSDEFRDKWFKAKLPPFSKPQRSIPRDHNQENPRMVRKLRKPPKHQ